MDDSHDEPLAGKPDDDIEKDDSATTSRPRPPKWKVTLVVTPIVVMTIAANIAAAFFPALIDNHPLVLVGFDARARNALLVTSEVGLASWFVVCIIRRTFFHPMYFLLGRWYGDRAIAWVNKQSPSMGQLLTQIEAWFPRFGPLIVAFYAVPVVCVLAGASKMRMLPFIAYNIIGNAIALAVLWKLGQEGHRQISAVNGFIKQYTLPLTIASIAVVGVAVLGRSKKGESPIESVGQIEDELESPSIETDARPSDGDRDRDSDRD